jgi:S1-C subfamily serine protease
MSTEGTVPMSSDYDPPTAAETGQTPPGTPAPGADSAGYGGDGYQGQDHPARYGPANPARSGGTGCYGCSSDSAGYTGPAATDSPGYQGGPEFSGDSAGPTYPGGSAAPTYPGGPGYQGDSGYPGYQGDSGYPGGYGNPAESGGGRHRAPKSLGRRFGRPVLMSGVALAVGLGTFFGLQAAGVGHSPTVLTTSQIAAQTDPGLVDIVSTLGYQQAQAAGTGLVLTSSGEVLTNNHVIDGATSITVTDIGNGRSYHAKVVGYDQTKDVAVLQLQGASGLQTVNLGNSSAAKVGEKVVAIGNAEGKGGTPSVVTGKITGLNAAITASDEGSGTSEQLSGLISHNAPIQPGDSGGPLVNTAGQVIGIDTAGSSSSSPYQAAQTTATQAFAIPINEALSIADQIEAGHGSATVHIGATGFLGVEVTSASNAAAEGVPTGSGASIAGVLSGSPAENAGITAGDVITSVDGQAVSSPSALQAAMEQHHPGDRVTIGWTDQNGQSQSASVALATGPAA